MKTMAKLLMTAGLVAGVTAGAQADGDATKGKRVYMKCKACHSMEPGKRMVGPSLAGIFGRTAGTTEGFKFSKVMAESGIVWDDANMAEFLKSPRKFMKGTKMTFPGIRKDDQIADLIAYLKENGA